MALADSAVRTVSAFCLARHGRELPRPLWQALDLIIIPGACFLREQLPEPSFPGTKDFGHCVCPTGDVENTGSSGEGGQPSIPRRDPIRGAGHAARLRGGPLAAAPPPTFSAAAVRGTPFSPDHVRPSVGGAPVPSRRGFRMADGRTPLSVDLAAGPASLIVRFARRRHEVQAARAKGCRRSDPGVSPGSLALGRYPLGGSVAEARARGHRRAR